MEVSLIPPSAPFNAEQRAWLNGFLAGWLGIQGPNGATPPIGLAVESAKLVEAPAAEEPAPWHDPALGIEERLALAQDKPLPRRLMAAMAQLDCGTCGYLCHSYADAIAVGAEPKLNLCSPGGSATSKAIKKLLKEQAAPNGDGKGKAAAAAPKPVAKGWSRDNPYMAKIVRTFNLNKDGSEKETRHVEIETAEGGPEYHVGDSLGVFPENCPALVDEFLAAIGAAGDERVTPEGSSETDLREALVGRCCLTEVTEGFLETLAGASTDPEEAAFIRALVDEDAPIRGFDVVDVLNRFPRARPRPADVIAALSPLKPRLYSISSSPKRHNGQVHLTVRKVVYQFNGRGRKGVASTMFADRVAAGTPIRVFVQKSHGFRPPADPKAPMVMIGPGTGIAPFRAFLHERDVLGASGKNWLFYGDQRSAHDFLYEDELTEFHARGFLTNLDTAFSRDGDRKVYVQHRIVERGEELFRWLEEGAHVYVCGDAKQMAPDVDRALREVVRTHGRLGEDEAKAYVAKLASAGRYLRDVY